jgi:hypothetical protein
VLLQREQLFLLPSEIKYFREINEIQWPMKTHKKFDHFMEKIRKRTATKTMKKS